MKNFKKIFSILLVFFLLAGDVVTLATTLEETIEVENMTEVEEVEEDKDIPKESDKNKGADNGEEEKEEKEENIKEGDELNNNEIKVNFIDLANRKKIKESIIVYSKEEALKEREIPGYILQNKAIDENYFKKNDEITYRYIKDIDDENIKSFNIRYVEKNKDGEYKDIIDSNVGSLPTGTELKTVVDIPGYVKVKGRDEVIIGEDSREVIIVYKKNKTSIVSERESKPDRAAMVLKIVDENGNKVKGIDDLPIGNNYNYKKDENGNLVLSDNFNLKFDTFYEYVDKNNILKDYIIVNLGYFNIKGLEVVKLDGYPYAIKELKVKSRTKESNMEDYIIDYVFKENGKKVNITDRLVGTAKVGSSIETKPYEFDNFVLKEYEVYEGDKSEPVEVGSITSYDDLVKLNIKKRINNNENRIKFIYEKKDNEIVIEDIEKNLSKYKEVHRDRETNEEIKSYLIKAYEGDIITHRSENFIEYLLEGPTTKKVQVNKDQEDIFFEYRKIKDSRYVEYTVNHKFKKDGKEIDILTEKHIGIENQLVEHEQVVSKFENYKFDRAEPEYIVLEKDRNNTINLYYNYKEGEVGEKDEYVTLTIKHKNKFAESLVEERLEFKKGSTINISGIYGGEVEGINFDEYQLITNSPIRIEMTKDKEINFIYHKLKPGIIGYQIRYVYEDDGDYIDIISRRNGYADEGSIVRANAKYEKLGNLTLKSVKSKDINKGKEKNITDVNEYFHINILNKDEDNTIYFIYETENGERPSLPEEEPEEGIKSHEYKVKKILYDDFESLEEESKGKNHSATSYFGAFGAKIEHHSDDEINLDDKKYILYSNSPQTVVINGEENLELKFKYIYENYEVSDDKAGYEVRFVEKIDEGIYRDIKEKFFGVGEPGTNITIEAPRIDGYKNPKSIESGEDIETIVLDKGKIARVTFIYERENEEIIPEEPEKTEEVKYTINKNYKEAATNNLFKENKVEGTLIKNSTTHLGLNLEEVINLDTPISTPLNDKFDQMLLITKTPTNIKLEGDKEEINRNLNIYYQGINEKLFTGYGVKYVEELNGKEVDINNRNIITLIDIAEAELNFKYTEKLIVQGDKKTTKYTLDKVVLPVEEGIKDNGKGNVKISTGKIKPKDKDQYLIKLVYKREDETDIKPVSLTKDLMEKENLLEIKHDLGDLSIYETIGFNGESTIIKPISNSKYEPENKEKLNITKDMISNGTYEIDYKEKENPVEPETTDPENPVEPEITEPEKPTKPEENKPEAPENPSTSGGGGGGGGGSISEKEPEENIIIEPEEIEENEAEEIVEKEIVENNSKLNTSKDLSYITGYKDNTIRPTADITREEVSTIVFRVLDEDYREDILSKDAKFNDVKGTWSEEAIATLSKGNIINGFKDGSFKPKQNMTRGEVATILARLNDLDTIEGSKFKDTKGHWAEKSINAVAKEGWIKGYSDSTFKPNEEITRAELITMINRMLNRSNEDLNNKEIKHYEDLDKDTWYYKEIQLAVK